MQMSTCTPFGTVGSLKDFEVGFVGDLLVQVGRLEGFVLWVGILEYFEM